MVSRLDGRLRKLERAQLGPGAALSVFCPGAVLRLDGGRVVFSHDDVVAALAPTDAEMDAVCALSDDEIARGEFGAAEAVVDRLAAMLEASSGK